MASYEEIGSVNSEIRYMTIELMKIAAERKVPFEKVAQEFLSNTISLHEMIQKIESAEKTRKK